MKRTEMSRTLSRYDSKFYSAAQNHESSIQKLRHERKTENQHLDGIKKTLQDKLSASSGTCTVRAA